MTVRRVRVGEIAEQIRGVTFAKADSSPGSTPGYLPVLRAGNIQDGRLDFTDLLYVPASYVRDKQKVKRNDIVIAASSGSLEVVGKAARSLFDFEGGFGAFCKVLRPTADVHPSYFAHYFQTRAYRKKVTSLAEGVNINNLKNEHLDDLIIPLPPFEEQRRIATILDQASAVCEKRGATLAILADMRRSLYSVMFRSCASWPVVRLGSLISDSRLGLVRSASEQGGDLPYEYVKMDAITRDGDLALSSPTRVAANADEVERCSVEDGDLLFNTRNTRELVGKSVVYRGRSRLFNNNLLRLRFTDAVLSDYVHGFLWSSDGRRQLDSRKSGTTSVFAVYAKNLATIELPVAPLSLQREYANRLRLVREHVDRALAHRQALDSVFASLHDQAFSGRL
ncbi:Type-1 restriction enzyme StySPI [Modestobacter italicus]|uniref:Type-1 restriction enzyme StySPI n=1 Tax=Modestobacter italicus (strain DSM 44449 / CECT 9708 / BC 501) TaxID=2732864 RepID=I4F1L8_MODI5|nr:restriction endonuclease subunit S [Modestobacter marinus]CCH89531.1 Type-1 restriction enzyme StySPI [Modestobacter marinus]